MKKLFLGALASLLIASPASAGQAQAGKIFSLFSTEFGVVMFHSNGARSSIPSCVGAGMESRFAIDVKNDAGKSMYALLLTAVAQGKQVWINGTGNCSIWGDTESVNYVYVAE